LQPQVLSQRSQEQSALEQRSPATAPLALQAPMPPARLPASCAPPSRPLP